MDINKIGFPPLYKWVLTSLRSEQDHEALTRMLGVIGIEINQCGRNIKVAENSNNPEYHQIVVDEECEIIEDLLGIAFVICQNQITNVCSRLIKLHKMMDLHTTDGTKAGIMKLAKDLLPKNSLTKIELIDAFANYYKHRDEWNHSWSQLEGNPKLTADKIIAAGGEERSTGNFRTVAHNIGIKDFENLTPLIDIVISWKLNVAAQYESEFKNNGAT